MVRASRIHRANGGWRFRYLGKPHWRAQYADALALYAEVVVAKPVGCETPITVAEAVAAWLLNRPSDYHRHISAKFDAWYGAVLLDKIDRDFLEKYRARLVREKYSQETVRKAVFAASGILKNAVDAGWLKTLPSVPRCPSPPPAPKGITHIKLGALLSELESRPTTDHIAPLVRFAADTGMRPSEVCRLKWVDIDIERAAIVLTEHKTAKRTAKARIVVLSSGVVDQLKARERSGQYVFTNRSGKPYSAAGFLATLRRYGVTPNQLRHTFAQSMIDSGVMPELVTSMLGHRTSKMVWQYAEIHAARVRDALSKVESPSQLAHAAQSQQATDRDSQRTHARSKTSKR